MSWPVLALAMAIAFFAGVITNVFLPDVGPCAMSAADAYGVRTTGVDGTVETLDEALDRVDPTAKTLGSLCRER